MILHKYDMLISVNMLNKHHEEITKHIRVVAPEIKFCYRQITHEQRKLEISFFFVTYCLHKTNIFAKFHDSILCGTTVMARDL